MICLFLLPWQHCCYVCLASKGQKSIMFPKFWGGGSRPGSVSIPRAVTQTEFEQKSELFTDFEIDSIPRHNTYNTQNDDDDVVVVLPSSSSSFLFIFISTCCSSKIPILLLFSFCVYFVDHVEISNVPWHKTLTIARRLLFFDCLFLSIFSGHAHC